MLSAAEWMKRVEGALACPDPETAFQTFHASLPVPYQLIPYCIQLDKDGERPLGLGGWGECLASDPDPEEQFAIQGASLPPDLLAALELLATHFRTLDKISGMDALTGLGNRRAFERHAARMLARFQRYQVDAALVLIDLKGFKKINDEQGFSKGDQILRQVAGVLQQHLRSGDVCARIGGDEFVLLLNQPDPTTLSAVQARMQDRLKETCAVSMHSAGCRLSEAHPPPGSVTQWLARVILPKKS